MPIYRISGAERDTGVERTLLLAARDEKHAQELAVYKNLLVSEIVLDTPDTKPTPQTAKQAAEMAIPDYRGLELASRIFIFEAVLCYIAGAVCLVIGIGLMIDITTREAALNTLFMSLGFILSGVFTHALSTGSQALRDIARNSFRNVK